MHQINQVCNTFSHPMTDHLDQYQNKAVDELLAWATTLDENKLREN